MNIALTISSIFVITGLVWLFNRIAPLRLRSGQAFKICPICAGVSGTWLWILIGLFSGQLPIADYQLPAAILMGGSVVGVAYQFERHLLKNEKCHLIWKTLFIPAGFATAYLAVSFHWGAIWGAAALIVLALIFGRRPNSSTDLSAEVSTKAEALAKAGSSTEALAKAGRHQPVSETVEKLEEKMKKCC